MCTFVHIYVVFLIWDFMIFFFREMAPEIESQSDPILEYHYRGHKAPVLCSAFNPNQKQVRLR